MDSVQGQKKRGRKKGSIKTGGRKKGTPNKRTETLMERAKALNVDPFEVLLLFAKGDWAALGYEHEFETKIGAGGAPVECRIIETDHRITAAKAACEYLHPKRKAVEITGENGGPLTFSQFIEEISGENVGE